VICRVCGTDETELICDLGDQLLSNFTMENIPGERYPLRLFQCNECYTWQLDNVAPPEALYHENYSFKSGVNPAIKGNLAEVVRHALYLRGGRETYNWLDIASNDGSLLACVPKGIKRVGIDPLHQFAEEARTHADRIIEDFFNPSHFTTPDGMGQFDVITAVSMFYDVPDPVQFVKDVSYMMDLDSVFIVQQNYLLDMIFNNSIDNVSHEHLAYHSLESMKYIADQAGLEIVDVEFSEINGGCFRVALMHKADDGEVATWYEVTDKVAKAFEYEDDVFWGCQRGELFAHDVKTQIVKLKELVKKIKAEGHNIMVYGASTRGGVLWQLAGLDHTQIDAVVERNPEKVGKYMTSIGVPIISEDEMRADPPDYLLVGPWWFKDQFIEREQEYIYNHGGQMIFPLPILKVVGA